MVGLDGRWPRQNAGGVLYGGPVKGDHAAASLDGAVDDLVECLRAELGRHAADAGADFGVCRRRCALSEKRER